MPSFKIERIAVSLKHCRRDFCFLINCATFLRHHRRQHSNWSEWRLGGKLLGLGFEGIFLLDKRLNELYLRPSHDCCRHFSAGQQQQLCISSKWVGAQFSFSFTFLSSPRWEILLHMFGFFCLLIDCFVFTQRRNTSSTTSCELIGQVVQFLRTSRNAAS